MLLLLMPGWILHGNEFMWHIYIRWLCHILLLKNPSMKPRDNLKSMFHFEQIVLRMSPNGKAHSDKTKDKQNLWWYHDIAKFLSVCRFEINKISNASYGYVWIVSCVDVQPALQSKRPYGKFSWSDVFSASWIPCCMSGQNLLQMTLLHSLQVLSLAMTRCFIIAWK